MPKAARICSVSLPLREPLPPRLRSTLAKASFRGRDFDSGTNVTHVGTFVNGNETQDARTALLIRAALSFCRKQATIPSTR